MLESFEQNSAECKREKAPAGLFGLNSTFRRVLSTSVLAPFVINFCGEVIKDTNTQVSNLMFPESVGAETDGDLVDSDVEVAKISPAKKLFDSILAQKDIFQADRELIISEDPNAPIVILLKDEHGSPEIELMKINELQRRFGIKDVAVEGWAGKRVDDARCLKILNGEAKLIRNLMEKDNINLIPLEDAELQEESLKALAAISYLKYIMNEELIEKCKDSDSSKPFGEWKSKDDAIEFLRCGSSNKNFVDARYEILHYAKEFGVIDAWVNIDKNDALNKWIEVGNNAEILPDFFIQCAAPYIDRKDLRERDGESFRDFINRLQKVQNETYELVLGEFANKRSAKAIELLYQQIKEKNLKTVVMVFGAGHADGLVDDLKKMGNSSVLVIDNKRNIAVEKFMAMQRLWIFRAMGIGK